MVRGSQENPNSIVQPPQGAVLSPFLWNVFLDTLLEQLSAFPNASADDVLLIIPFNRYDTGKLENTLQILFREADIWAQHKKPALALTKHA